MADKNDKNGDRFADIPHERSEPRPDFSKPPPPRKLPKAIQETLDDDEKLWATLYEGKAGESTDSNLRYAAYASRVRTILLSAHRYVAYTSDIGESFRPVAHPYLVKGAYAVSWMYLGGDVAHEGYKAYIRNQKVLHPEKPQEDQTKSVISSVKDALKPKGEKQTDLSSTASTVQSQPGRIVPIEDYRAVMAQRAVFQGLASMGLPAFTIHSIVKYSGKAMKDVKNKTIRTWGPIGLGLVVVPFLPFIFDQPVEHAVEWTFHKGFELVGGPDAVGQRPLTNRHELLQKEVKEKEKEL